MHCDGLLTTCVSVPTFCISRPGSLGCWRAGRVLSPQGSEVLVCFWGVLGVVPARLEGLCILDTLEIPTRDS